MGKTIVTLPEDVQKRRLLEQTPLLLEEIEILVRALQEDTQELLPYTSPGIRESFSPSTFKEVGEGLEKIRGVLKEETDLAVLKSIYSALYNSLDRILKYIEEGDKDFRVDTDPETGTRRIIEFKGERQSPNTRPLAELKKLSQLPSLNHINISKDLVSSEFQSEGDLLKVGTDKDRKKIEELQKRGKLLFGTLEGLSGGSAFFKSVSIALAKILNEQSNYYSQTPQGDKLGGHLLSGIPKDKVREVFGESAKLEGTDRKVPLRGGEREYPYIILSYERLAKEVSKTGRISGGKDIENIRLYINGGYREFETDPKTGIRKPISSSYVPGLASKKYPVSDGKGHFIFIPFVVNEGEIVDTSRKDPEVGCLLRLSPQYSKTLRGYTSLRGDTIQLIGGGRQKDITMDLLQFLAFSRNTAPVLRKLKSEILSKYKDKPTYQVVAKDPETGERIDTGKRRVKKLEEHFREAVQKSIEAKILQEYREEKNSGGETVSVFVYNPEYLKGEEISPDVQTGGTE